MSRREPYAHGRDRLSFYSKLLALGFSPDRANDVALKLSKDVFSYRQGKIYDASGRNVVVELPADPQEADPGERSDAKLARTKVRLLALAAR